MTWWTAPHPSGAQIMLAAKSEPRELADLVAAMVDRIFAMPAARPMRRAVRRIEKPVSIGAWPEGRVEYL